MHNKINNYLKETFKSNLKIEVISSSDYTGTAEAIKNIAHKINVLIKLNLLYFKKRNCIIISGDLITEADLNSITEFHTSNYATVTYVLKETLIEEP